MTTVATTGRRCINQIWLHHPRFPATSTLAHALCQFVHHPLDPEVHNGLQYPELGKEMPICEAVWMGDNVTVSTGIKVVQGAVLGAGSVVTKDVAPYTIVAANPARSSD